MSPSSRYTSTVSEPSVCSSVEEDRLAASWTSSSSSLGTNGMRASGDAGADRPVTFLYLIKQGRNEKCHNNQQHGGERQGHGLLHLADKEVERPVERGRNRHPYPKERLSIAKVEP